MSKNHIVEYVNTRISYITWAYVALEQHTVGSQVHTK